MGILPGSSVMKLIFFIWFWFVTKPSIVDNTLVWFIYFKEIFPVLLGRAFLGGEGEVLAVQRCEVSFSCATYWRKNMFFHAVNLIVLVNLIFSLNFCSCLTMLRGVFPSLYRWSRVMIENYQNNNYHFYVNCMRRQVNLNPDIEKRLQQELKLNQESYMNIDTLSERAFLTLKLGGYTNYSNLHN